MLYVTATIVVQRADYGATESQNKVRAERGLCVRSIHKHDRNKHTCAHCMQTGFAVIHAGFRRWAEVVGQTHMIDCYTAVNVDRSL